MAIRYLMMIEVSQKQAFIFKHKRLANNIYASNLIQYMTSEAYFKKEAQEEFEKGSVVYNGGGHTILEFSDEEDAKAFSRKITKNTLEKFQDLEVFVTIYPYDEKLSPEENEQELTKKLEEKKARRASSFYQRNFGIEAMGNGEKEKDLEDIYHIPEQDMVSKGPVEKEIQELLGKYTVAGQFEKLGGSKDESNFIAVIHIDGNLMGKRVGELASNVKCNIQEKTPQGWENYKRIKREFSEEIDKNFKQAYLDMLKSVSRQIDNENSELMEKLELKQVKGKYTFPVREIILAGDDVCFVTEGRIGLACAVAYLESIWKKTNQVDGRNYSACAGVAIVHQKYPFYRAYNLAEELCSNAKKMIAKLDDHAAANVCAIDWHIEFGEMESGLSEIRQQYKNVEGRHLEMRPYIVCGEGKQIEKEKIRRYSHFKEFISCLQGNTAACGKTKSSCPWVKENKTDSCKNVAARNKMKSLRTVLKDEEKTMVNYLKSNILTDMAWKAREFYELKEENQAEKLFYQTYDKEERNMLFDAIELMDTYITW